MIYRQLHTDFRPMEPSGFIPLFLLTALTWLASFAMLPSPLALANRSCEGVLSPQPQHIEFSQLWPVTAVEAKKMRGKTLSPWVQYGENQFAFRSRPEGQELFLRTPEQDIYRIDPNDPEYRKSLEICYSGIAWRLPENPSEKTYTMRLPQRCNRSLFVT